MRNKRMIVSFVILMALLLVVTGVQAMSSDNYHVDWFIPLTGGGGSATSAHYSAQVTIGQSIIGASSSPSYETGLGFWYGIWLGWKTFLPTIFR